MTTIAIAAASTRGRSRVIVSFSDVSRSAKPVCTASGSAARSHARACSALRGILREPHERHGERAALVLPEVPALHPCERRVVARRDVGDHLARMRERLERRLERLRSESLVGERPRREVRVFQANQGRFGVEPRALRRERRRDRAERIEAFDHSSAASFSATSATASERARARASSGSAETTSS